MTDFFGNKWVDSFSSLEKYPIGTKAASLNGGHWEKVENGWKWCNGATFPSIGGDWNGMVCIP